MLRPIRPIAIGLGAVLGLVLVQGCAVTERQPVLLARSEPIDEDEFEIVVDEVLDFGLRPLSVDRDERLLESDWVEVHEPGAAAQRRILARIEGATVVFLLETRLLQDHLFDGPEWTAARVDHVAERRLVERLELRLGLTER